MMLWNGIYEVVNIKSCFGKEIYKLWYIKSCFWVEYVKM